MKEKITKLVIIIMTITICGLMVVFDKVHAATITNWTTTQTRYWYDNNGTITNSGNWQTNPQTWTPTYPVARVQYRLTIPETFKTDSTYSFKIGWYSNPDSLGVETIYANFQGDDPTYANVSCTDFTRDDNGYNIATCTTTPNTDIASGSYFYIAIHFHESYVTQLKSYIKGYTSQLGTNAVIEQQTGRIIDAIDEIFTQNRQNAINIINNQNQNTEQQINAQKVCQFIDKSNIKTNNAYFNSVGDLITNNSWGITDYIAINKDTKILAVDTWDSGYGYYCLYNINKEKISCSLLNTISTTTPMTIGENVSYIKISINKNNNKPTLNICKNGNQALIDADYNYNNNASEDVSNSNITEAENKENQLLNSIDLSGTENITIPINPNASSFIWNIVEQLRGLNNKIVMLMTAILGLGIIKMILNR